jgi:hypothetical protein
MLCMKLGAVIRSRDMLQEILSNHVFEDGMAHPITLFNRQYSGPVVPLLLPHIII